jgi:hypothetical protein
MIGRPIISPGPRDHGEGDGEVGFVGAARFLEKNGRTFLWIRSRTLLV